MPRTLKKRSPFKVLLMLKQLDRESGEQTTSSGVKDTTSVRTGSGSDRNLPRALIVISFLLYDPVATAPGSDTGESEP